MTFLATYYPYIIGVVVILLGIIFGGKKKALSVAEGILYQYKDVLLKIAENQHDAYSQFIYDHVPVYVKVFLTEKMVDAIVVAFIAELEKSKPVAPVTPVVPEPTPAPVEPVVSGNATTIDNNQK